jgi:hypothetical protein
VVTEKISVKSANYQEFAGIAEKISVKSKRGGSLKKTSLPLQASKKSMEEGGK